MREIYRRNFSSGFSLIELSIVLILIALLVGGVVSGRSLIQAANVRAVAEEFSAHKSAITLFEEKYFALPGDFSNATGVWGSIGGAGGVNSPGCADVIGSGTATCNGDGDGQIEYREDLRGWQHLSNAGLTEGSYTGAHQDSDHVPGINVPESAFKPDVGWGLTVWKSNLVSWIGGSPSDSDKWGIDFTRDGYLFLGREGDGEDSTLREDAFSALEAWQIDKKMDDGKPGTGMVITTGPISNCTTTAIGDNELEHQINAEYDLESTINQACSLAMDY